MSLHLSERLQISLLSDQLSDIVDNHELLWLRSAMHHLIVMHVDKHWFRSAVIRAKLDDLIRALRAISLLSGAYTGQHCCDPT